jgi:hypothetical protein
VFNLEGEKMDSNFDMHLENPPVSQIAPQDADMDSWEPQFERWLRLADIALGNIRMPRLRPIVPRKN